MDRSRWIDMVRSVTFVALTAVVGLALPGLAAAQDQAPPEPDPAPVFDDATQTPSQLSVGVGQSQTIDAPWRVRRVSVTNPAVADVQVLSPQRVLVQGRGTGSTDLTLWSDQEESLQIVVNVTADVSDIQDQLDSLFPRSSFDVREVRDVVIVRGLLGRAEHAQQLRNFLDATELKYLDMTSVAGVQQVQLQVKIAEVSRNALQSLSVQTRFAGNDFISTVTAGSITDPTLSAAFPGSDLELLVEALAENGYLKLLAEPTLVALSGEEAEFLAGGEFPVPVSQDEESVTIEFKEFGVRLKFRPIVLGDGSIRLFVEPEVSELSDAGAVTIEGFIIPALVTRRVMTTVELKSGQSFAMAGLLSHSVNAQTRQVPGLGELPVIGPLFRSVRYSRNETELVVMVTASLVEPLNLVGDPPFPGDLHLQPTPWEFFLEGRIEGRSPAWLPIQDATRLRELGLDQLRGPGAWVRHREQGGLQPLK